jgi:hypothetical protein
MITALFDLDSLFNSLYFSVHYYKIYSFINIFLFLNTLIGFNSVITAFFNIDSIY